MLMDVKDVHVKNQKRANRGFIIIKQRLSLLLLEFSFLLRANRYCGNIESLCTYEGKAVVPFIEERKAMFFTAAIHWC